MIFTCPCCHARYSIDAASQDEAARDLLALRGDMPPRSWNPLISYLGLFRSKSRALAWDRALKLAREVMDLGREAGDWNRLETALCETVEALRLKGGNQLKNHNYLKRVLENAPSPQPSPTRGEGAIQSPSPCGRGQGGGGKRAAALASLAGWGAGDWLRAGIAQGLQALVAQALRGQPAAEMITLNADIWFVALNKVLTIEAMDAQRLARGFERLVGEAVEWPQPKTLITMLPHRPHRVSLPTPAPSAEEYEAGREKARRLSEEYGK